MSTPTGTKRTRSRTGHGQGGSFLMPTVVTPWVRAMAWASLLANSALILTGGTVRLTASGLGCPTWPQCTDDSWTNTPEMGIHGVIEFGNRTLTFVLTLIAVLTFMSVWRMRHRYRDFIGMALALGLGIVVQAVVGGVTVLTGLNPWVVGIHFVISAVLIGVAGVLVNRVRRVSLSHVARAEAPGQLAGAQRRWARLFAAVIMVSGALTVYFGTLVTGTGPYSGDAGEVVRHAFDTYIIARVHVAPVYVIVLVTLAALGHSLYHRWPRPVTRALGVLFAVLVVQGLIGYYQWFNGVPVLAVAGHLVGAAAVTAVMTMTSEKLLAVSSHRVRASENELVR